MNKADGAGHVKEGALSISPRTSPYQSRSLDRSNPNRQVWVAQAIRRIEAEAQRGADTPLIQFPLPKIRGVDLYLKDESSNVTGSLKYRLARSMFLYALCNGWLADGTTVIEASSGSTAVSESYFAQLIGLPFIAVMPRSTSPQKIALIQAQGGRCHLVDDVSTIDEESRKLAAECSGHYMDQFTYAERATDWRGNSNIAESIFGQMSLEEHPIPEWIIAAAGTGGSSATLGRYIRYRSYATRLCVPDPEHSAFFSAWCTSDWAKTDAGSNIEGIGRPRVEPSFIGTVIDRMMMIPDASSVAAMREAETVLGLRVGPSTGTNLWAAFTLANEMRVAGIHGSLVALLCDGGERYADTYYNDQWVVGRGWDLAPAREFVTEFLMGGVWQG